MRKLGVGIAALGLAFLACVADSGGSRTSASDAATSADTGVVIQSDGSVQDSSPQDSGVSCEPGKTPCGAACVDLQTSGDHCNACGHSCGGGTCVAGACKPVPRVMGQAAHDFAIDGNILVFTAGNFVQSCSVDGPCAGAGLKKLADFTAVNPGGTGVIAAASGSFDFAGNTDGNARLYDCPLATGCTTLVSKGTSMAGFPIIRSVTRSSTSYSVYAHNPMTGILGFTCTSGVCGALALAAAKTEAANLLGLSATKVYYSATTGGAVYSCPIDSFPCTGTAFMATPALSFAVTGAQRYLRFTTPQGRSAIGHCPEAGCPGGNNQPSIVWQTIGQIESFTADEDEIFWAETGGGGNLIRSCKRGACALPRDLAPFAVTPTKMIVTPKSLFWIDTNGDVVSLAR
ncbi:MAG: hypothetical protein U0174_05910 [Polyangiaceae bacterium]